MNYWMVVTSPENFKYDREILGSELDGSLDDWSHL